MTHTQTLRAARRGAFSGACTAPAHDAAPTPIRRGHLAGAELSPVYLWDGEVLWAFADVDGKEITKDEFLANPDRLAAAYFADARDADGNPLRNQRFGSLFREYFVCNEKMIKSWSAYTPAIRAELDRGTAAVEALLAELQQTECETVARLPNGTQLPQRRKPDRTARQARGCALWRAYRARVRTARAVSHAR